VQKHNIPSVGSIKFYLAQICTYPRMMYPWICDLFRNLLCFRWYVLEETILCIWTGTLYVTFLRSKIPSWLVFSPCN